MPDRRPAGLVRRRRRRAARILVDAKYPIIYGLSDTTSEAQRRGRFDRRLDRRLRRHDDKRSAMDLRASPFKTWARSRARLGEIKNRGDLIIVWGSNPAREPSAPLHEVQPDAPGRRSFPAAARTGIAWWWTCAGPKAPTRPTCSSDQAAQGLRGTLDLARTGQGRRARRRPDRGRDRRAAFDLAGTHGPHETGEVRRDPLRHRD